MTPPELSIWYEFHKLIACKKSKETCFLVRNRQLLFRNRQWDNARREKLIFLPLS
jgi:hypothetical protein